MGTRSITFVHEDDQPQPLVCIYQQYDGYFSGVGDRLVSFLKGSKVVNGIGMNDGVTQFNGAGDLAARLITFLKNGDADDAGNVYIMPSDTKADQCGAEFVYHIYASVGDEPRLQASCVYGGPTVYGDASEIVWPVEDEDEDGPILASQRMALFATFTEVFGHAEAETRYAFTRMVLGLPATQIVSWSDARPGTITTAEAGKVLDALNVLNV